MAEEQAIKYAPQWNNMTVDNSTAVAYDPFPSIDEPEQRPLREFLNKFSVLNRQRPITLDFNTFCSSTGLDYNNGKYVAHTTPEAVKKELGKIAINPMLLGSDYTQDKKFRFLPSILSSSNFTKDPSKVIDIELMAHMIAVNNQKDSVSPPLLSAKPKKGKPQTMTPTLPKSQGPEASRALSKKRQKPKSKKPPTKTKATSTPKPTEGSEQSHLVSSGTVPDPQDLERNIQLASMGLPFTLDEGTRQSQPLPEDYWDKEEQIKKAKEQARLLAISKHEVIKVVQEEAEKIRLDPKKITTAKACEKFKNAQDAEHQVLKREHSKKVKRLTKLNKKRAEEYMWTMTNRIKPEPITDVKIHPNTKPVVVSVYRNNDKRNFDVHNPFKFTDFGITELDELGKKRKHMELKPEVKVPGLECNRILPEGVPFVNNMVIEEPEYGIFFMHVFGGQAFQRWNDIHKVGLDSLVSYLVMALMVKTQENARFSLKLRKLIADHHDQEKLMSKKVKLEALGYKMD
ncbi:hypothetical protein Tco_0622293 [Tanacetum coccineum]